MREVPPRERNAILAFLLANPAPAPNATGDALGQPRMSPMVDLGSFNNPPPPVQAPPSLDEFNSAEPLPIPPVQMPVPLPRAPRPMAAAGGLTTDDLNRMALMQALGQAQPAGQSVAELGAWSNIERRMKMT